MASSINATTNSGLVYNADLSGNLALQTTGVAAMTIDTTQKITINSANGLVFSDGSQQTVAGASPGLAVAMAIVFGGS
jgi:hypothetical protein